MKKVILIAAMAAALFAAAGGAQADGEEWKQTAVETEQQQKEVSMETKQHQEEVSAEEERYKKGPSAEKEWRQEQTAADERHETIIRSAPSISRENFVFPMDETEPGFSFEELQRLKGEAGGYAPEKTISREEALEDVNLLEKCFSHLYAGYGYFGGEETFGPALDKIREEIEKSGEELPAGGMEEILRENLSFVEDAHFQIADRPVMETEYVYCSEEVFFQDEKGYYREDGDERKYLHSIDRKSPKEVLKRSLAEDGTLAYRAVKTDTVLQKALSLELVYEDYTKEEILAWNQFFNETKGNTAIPENAALIRLGSFQEEEAVRRAARGLRAAKEKEFLILDLRGNGGGYPEYGGEWLEEYGLPLGDCVYGKERGQLLSIAWKLWDTMNQPGENWTEEELEALTETDEDYQKNEWNITEKADSFPEELLDGEQTILFLTDKNTASAAETFLLTFLNRKNVLLMGTPTSGRVQFSGGRFPYTLPNSGIKLYLGNQYLLFYDNQYLPEGKGIEPDLWTYGDALSQAVEMIGRYGEENVS